MKLSWQAICMVAVLALLGRTAEAREASGGLRDVTVIQDGRGSARVLFRAQEEIRALSDVSVWKARLTVPLSGAAADGSLRLRIYPVTRAWTSGSATWSSGWTDAGGDFDEEVFAAYDLDLRSGPTEMTIDVTRLLKEALEHGVASEGFIVTVDPRAGVGLPAADLSRLGSLSGATLEVQYRKSLRPRAG